MGRRRGALALLGPLALGLAACGGGGDDAKTGTSFVNTRAAAIHISQTAERLYSKDADVGAVSCPERVPAQKGLTFVCTLDIDGELLVYRVIQTNDDGGSRFEQAQAVISTKTAEKFATAYGKKHGTPVREVSCGTRVSIIRAPGARFTCPVEFEAGASGVVTFKVLDAAAHIDLISLAPDRD
jgi:hypothetical protein